MATNSIQYTGVCTLDTLFTWSRLPFGVRNGPPHFQRTVAISISQHKLADVAGAFIDNLATGGLEHKQSARNLASLLRMLCNKNLHAGATKVLLGLTVMGILGRRLKAGSVTPSPDKVDAIVRLLTPQTCSEVCSNLGLMYYYHEFVHRYSTIAAPLTTLLAKDTPWVWSPC